MQAHPLANRLQAVAQEQAAQWTGGGVRTQGGGTEHFGCMRPASAPFRERHRDHRLNASDRQEDALARCLRRELCVKLWRIFVAPLMRSTHDDREHAASCSERRCGRNRAGREGAFEACHPRLRAIALPYGRRSASPPSSARQSLITGGCSMLDGVLSRRFWTKVGEIN